MVIRQFCLIVLLFYLSGCATTLYNQYHPDDNGGISDLISNGSGNLTQEEIIKIWAEDIAKSNQAYLFSTKFKLILNSSEQKITSLVVYRNKLYASTSQPNGFVYEYDQDRNISKVVLRTESYGISSLAVYDDQIFRRASLADARDPAQGAGYEGSFGNPVFA